MNKTCAISAILAVITVMTVFGAIYLGEASYTPVKPVIASWEEATNVPKNKSVNGTWVSYPIAEQEGGRVLYSNPPSQNAAVRWRVVFPDTATHTIYVRVYTEPAAGIITISLNGVNQSVIDLYSAGGVANVTLSAKITSPMVGKNILQFWVATKNPSSSNYYVGVSEWWII